MYTLNLRHLRTLLFLDTLLPVFLNSDLSNLPIHPNLVFLEETQISYY